MNPPTSIRDNWLRTTEGSGVALGVSNFAGRVAELRTGNVRFLAEPLDFPSGNLAANRDPHGDRLVIHKKKHAA
jgi:hypothetical protein